MSLPWLENAWLQRLETAGGILRSRPGTVFRVCRAIHPKTSSFYGQIAAEDSSAPPSRSPVSLDSQPDGSLTLRWRLPSGPRRCRTDLVATAGKRIVRRGSHSRRNATIRTTTTYALFCAGSPRLVYRSLVARFEERFAVERESRLVLHRSPVESLEVVGADDYVTEPARVRARSLHRHARNPPQQRVQTCARSHPRFCASACKR